MALGGAAASAALLTLACLGSGCSSVGYYVRSAGGHLALLAKAQPIAQITADAATPALLRERLLLTQRMRDFAVTELALPDNRSYRRYADLGRGAAVWNVVAAPELSLVLKTWCFPVVGCVGYRGYYERAQADAEAAELRARGLEVFVYGVPAYSTLGKLDWLGGDPLLNTFVDWPEGELARLVFHELAHQVVYVADDTMFNESFATAVERLGGTRWLAAHGSAATRADDAALDLRRTQFRGLTLRYRDRLDALFRSSEADDAKRAGKAMLMAEMRAEHAALRAGIWRGPNGPHTGYDPWFERANNAALGVLATYNEGVPNFERLFEREGRDFPRFYAAVKSLAALPKAERQATLRAI